VCMVEDPSNQYIYTSNYNDGTVTGYQLNNTSGELSDLTKGSTFTAVGKASCLAISGAVE
jgi:6-phosphogluconolactonase (cycloisomerase 2 family)